MLKAKLTTTEGKVVMVLGLSAENIRRLQAGQPIQFALSEISMGQGDCLIIAGGTEQDLAIRVSDLAHGKPQGQG